jgi:hypothetical protein
MATTARQEIVSRTGSTPAELTDPREGEVRSEGMCSLEPRVLDPS